jgi:GDPmannose 4,6-dehydratase
MKRALITGITGQDGSYLAEYLIEKGYEVHGIVRRVALEDPEHRLWRIAPMKEYLRLHAGSLESLPSLYRVLQAVRPDECYHLAAQSFVAYSFEDEFSTLNANINGTHHMLAALRDVVPQCKFYFAASSEMFGKVEEVPQTERTPFHPRSAYGISKVAGFDLTRNYREAYGLFACSGILYNHESPRRGYEFVTRKITSHAARIKLGMAKELKLGNLDARRDWGHAREYVKAMWLMLQQPTPDDYVVATGEQHTVRAFAEAAFRHLGMDYRDYVQVDPQFLRPADVETLLGDCSKARNNLGWSYTLTFNDLVTEMVEADMRWLHSPNKSST